MGVTGIYKGLRNIEKHALKETADPATEHEKWFGNDINLIPVLEHLAGRSCNADNYNPSRNYQQPIIALIKACRLNDLQLDLLKHIADHPRLTTWDGMVYNGKGIYVFSRNSNMLKHLKGKNGKIIYGQAVKIDKKGDESISFSNCLFFKGQQVNTGIQYFYDLNKLLIKQKMRSVSHVAIIAGDKANRCISFVSQNYKWHLTHMYYVPSEDTKIPNIIQSVGRLCGKFDDHLPLFLYAPDDVLKDLVKGIEIQEEMIERARHIEGMQSCGSVVKVMKISSFKIPIRPLGTQEDTVITTEQTVKGSDIEFGGFSRNIYRKAVKEIKEGDYPMTIYDEKINENKSNYDVVQEDYGTLIKEPRKDSSLHNVYNSIINRLNGKGWINRATLRIDNTVKNSARFTELQTNSDVNSTKGLLWRRLPGKLYEYRYIS